MAGTQAHLDNLVWTPPYRQAPMEQFGSTAAHLDNLVWAEPLTALPHGTMAAFDPGPVSVLQGVGGTLVLTSLTILPVYHHFIGPECEAEAEALEGGGVLFSWKPRECASPRLMLCASAFTPEEGTTNNTEGALRLLRQFDCVSLFCSFLAGAVHAAPPAALPNTAVALMSKLSGDEQRVIFSKLCNVLNPRDAVAFSSASSELRTVTRPLQQQLRADHEVAAALCLKLLNWQGMALWGTARRCKALREVEVLWPEDHTRLCSADMTLLGMLGTVLPALEELVLCNRSVDPDGVQRLADKLGAGALPAVTWIEFKKTHVGDAGASALAAALGRGALPRLKHLYLGNTAIGDAGLVALAPALRRLPALEALGLSGNPLGDEGLAALVAPPPPAGAPPTTTGRLTKLKALNLERTQIAEAGCAALAAALDSGALPALKRLSLIDTPAWSNQAHLRVIQLIRATDTRTVEELLR